VKNLFLEQKTILVTGGTGSMGKTFVRRVLSGEMGTPKKIIVMSRDEGKQHNMRLSYLNKKNSTDETIYNNFKNLLEFRIGDVRNYADVVSALKTADVVINAAALKQVPSCEYFPEQALLTNCTGAANIVRAIHEHSLPVHTVVGVSTDKACKPINAMGMTKALQERIFIAANILKPSTRYLCVRYGNVLASRGSVIPLFHDQIKNNTDVTITDVGMTRFLLSLNQAVDTVFKALVDGKAGEIIVPRAPAALMTDVATALIENRPIKTKVTGIRPGEKLHEIMISDEEAPYAEERGEWYAIRSMLPELNPEGPNPKSPLKKEFSSGDTLLDLTGTKNLLAKHKLLINDHAAFSDDEMLA
jgi:FlaA1/EpsC-like NDP-sugar epimerase